MAYTYTDEHGILHDVVNGYGMDPLLQGYKSELYESCIIHGTIYDATIGDFKEVKTYTGIPSTSIDPITGRPYNEREYVDEVTKMPDNLKVGAFLSGRYE